MKSTHSYEDENTDEIMEAHYLEMQADHRSHRELESELQWAYDELSRRAIEVKAWQEKYTALSYLHWEIT